MFIIGDVGMFCLLQVLITIAADIFLRGGGGATCLEPWLVLK